LAVSAAPAYVSRKCKQYAGAREQKRHPSRKNQLPRWSRSKWRPTPRRTKPVVQKRPEAPWSVLQH
jgi:hypothetical protein